MVEESGCRFCGKWDHDVGAVYDATPQGHLAPLLRVKRGASELSGLKPVVYTPTFVLMRGENEIGRITGYPGESFFWQELEVLLDVARPDDAPGPPPDRSEFAPRSLPSSGLTLAHRDPTDTNGAPLVGAD